LRKLCQNLLSPSFQRVVVFIEKNATSSFQSWGKGRQWIKRSSVLSHIIQLIVINAKNQAYFAALEIILKGDVLLKPSLQRAARNIECSLFPLWFKEKH
jgi:hypothetical protein